MTHTDFGVPYDFWERIHLIVDHATPYGKFSYAPPNLIFREGYEHEVYCAINLTDLEFLTAQGIIDRAGNDPVFAEPLYKLTDRGRELKRIGNWKKFERYEKWKSDGSQWSIIKDKFWWVFLLAGWLIGFATYWIQEGFLKHNP